MCIRIVTDSAADMSAALLEQLNVTCVPLSVAFGDEVFLDNTTISLDDFYGRMIAGESPKTSQPTPEAFLKVFEEAKAAGDAVVYVGISSALSGTVQSATLARTMAEYDEIYIVDSLTATAAEQILVRHACKLRDEGKLSAAEIAAELTNLRSRVHLYACVDTLEYLARGGRISRAAANIGTLVQLKPQLTINAEGTIDVIGKAIGRHRAMEAMVRLIKNANVDPNFNMLSYYAHQADNCQAYSEKLRKANFSNIEENAVAMAGTIGTHVGPGTYGAAFVAAE